MSQIIADLGETLVSILREGFEGVIPHPEEAIVLSSPGDLGPAENPRLCLFLYHLRENIALRNAFTPEERRPPLALDLYFMLTAYAPSRLTDRTSATLEEYRLLGRAMAIFHRHLVLRDPYLRGELAGQGLEFRLILHPLPVEEMARIWNAFHSRPFKLSVCYLLTPVIMETPLREKEPVREILLDLEARK
ncbi:MAG TPA: DUF4255 domain-containing protein [Thermosulfurimonas dismutans]|uniref:DUF4255 domain-containing protein n=1 Tax=Thermosulfurimonas dismutans TaxID=999894 RepID=A0A7C3H373_9BACT|nr:DUF4255 domain-containing protein [Thermosulfurimonas dismutans]